MIILGQCQINESFPLTLLSNRMSGHNVGVVLVVPYGPIERLVSNTIIDMLTFSLFFLLVHIDQTND